MKACVRKPDSTEWRTGLPSQDVFVARQFQHEHFVEAGDRREVESVEALHRREPGGTDPTFDRAAFPVDEFQFDEALLNGGRLEGRRLAPNDSEVAVRLGQFLLFLGRPREALVHIEAAIDRDPVHGRNYAALC